MTGLDLTTADRRGNVVRVRTEAGETRMLSVTDAVGLVFDLELADIFATANGKTKLSNEPEIHVGLEENGSFLFEYDENTWLLAEDEAERLVRAVDTYERTGSVAQLRQLHQQKSSQTVRQAVVNAFVPCVDASVTPLDIGWLVDSLIVLTWDGRMVPFSGDTEAPLEWENDNWQLYGFTNVDDSTPTDSLTIDGTSVTLRSGEWSFLQRAAWVANRESFGQREGLYESYWRNFERAVDRSGLGTSTEAESSETVAFFDAADPIIDTGGTMFGDSFDTVEQSVPTADGITPIYDQAKAAAADFGIGSYRSHTSGEPHTHPPTEHDSRDVFNISDELIADVLHFSPKDHGVLHELLARRESLARRPEAVFTDTDDHDENRWGAIEAQRDNAHIDDGAQVYLEAVFDY